LTASCNYKQSLGPIQLKKSIRIPTQRSIAITNNREIEKEKQREKDKDVIISVNKGHKEVLSFLQELNMGEFFDNFINNGIVNREKLFYLNNDNLKLINIPYAYRVRFLKKLKEIENINSMKKSINEKGRLSKIKLKKGQNESKYEEIIIPKEEDDKEVSNEEMRKTFTQAIYDFQKTHSKFEFQKNNESTDKNIKMSTDEGTNSKNENETNNFEEPIEVGEYIENKDKTSKVKELLPLNSKKILCYQCWNVILSKDCLSKYEKPFCSEKCFKLYESINYTNCRTCSKKIKFAESLPSFNNRNVYYCSLDCLEKIEPERKNWVKKNLIDDDDDEVSPSKNNNAIENPIDILDL